MSLHAPLFYHIPEQTVAIAQAAFPKGNPSMRMRDALGPLFTNPDFAHLLPKEGQPAYAPAQLALITIMQFAEGLSDAQTAHSVRGRIDWKYALALELTDSCRRPAHKRRGESQTRWHTSQRRGARWVGGRRRAQWSRSSCCRW